METTQIRERIAEIDTERKALYAKWTYNGGKSFATSGEPGRQTVSEVRAYVKSEYARLMRERERLVAQMGA